MAAEMSKNISAPAVVVPPNTERTSGRQAVVAVDAPHSMAYTWKGDEDTDDVTTVTYTLKQTPEGTRFTWHHTGFTGVGGFAMSKLLRNVRRKMLAEGVPAVLTAHRPDQP